MAGRRWWRVRAAIVVVAAFGISLRVGAAAFALTPSIIAPLRDDCNPCVTVVDVPAYSETLTIVDRAAYDETVTVVDAPASTVARQVLVTAGHNQIVSTLVPGHYERGADQRVSQGYWQGANVSYTYQTWDFVTSGYSSNDLTWVQVQLPPAGPSGVYVTSQSCSSWSGPVDDRTCSSLSYTTAWNAGGSYVNYPTGYGWSCSTDEDDFGRSHTYCGYAGYSDNYVWTPSVLYGYVQQTVNTYHDTSGYRWVSHTGTQWNAQYQWIDTSYWQATATWVAGQYITAATSIPSGSLQDLCVGGVWQWNHAEEESTCSSGNIVYAQWVSTAYTAVPNQVWVDPVYTAVYDPVAAVTHQATVHHNAVTHNVVVVHPAVTHQAQATATTSESTQGAGTGSGGTGGTASTPVTIPVVSTITLIDLPATTNTVTVVDQAAYDETVSTAVYDTDCEVSCRTYIDHYDTTTVHHAAVTHDVTTMVPAVTHNETLQYDAIVGGPIGSDGSSSDSPDGGLLAFAAFAGLAAAAKAGRFASSADAVRSALRDWSLTGEAVPAGFSSLVTSSGIDDTGATSATRIMQTAVAHASPAQSSDALGTAQEIFAATAPAPGGSPNDGGGGGCDDATRAKLLDNIQTRMRGIDVKKAVMEREAYKLTDAQLERHMKYWFDQKTGLENALKAWDDAGCGDPPAGAAEKLNEPTPVPDSKFGEPNPYPAQSISLMPDPDANITIDPGYVTVPPPYNPRTDPNNYDPINGIYLLDPDPIGTAFKFIGAGVIGMAALAVAPLDLLAGIAALATAAEPAYGAPVPVP